VEVAPVLRQRQIGDVNRPAEFRREHPLHLRRADADFGSRGADDGNVDRRRIEVQAFVNPHARRQRRAGKLLIPDITIVWQQKLRRAAQQESGGEQREQAAVWCGREGFVWLCHVVHQKLKYMKLVVPRIINANPANSSSAEAITQPAFNRHSTTRRAGSTLRHFAQSSTGS